MRAPGHVINKQHGRPSRVLTRRVLLFTNRTEGLGYIDETLTRVIAIRPAMAAKLDVPDKSGGIKEKDKDSEEKEGACLSIVVICVNHRVHREICIPQYMIKHVILDKKMTQLSLYIIIYNSLILCITVYYNM